MDSLIKQIRSRFSRERREESFSAKDRRIPPQRTQSFKTEKKRSQNWFQRQISRNMSQDYDSEKVMEHATAVAATAYAIKSLEDSPIPDQTETSGASDSFLTSLRSKKEDTSTQGPEPGRVSKRFSGEHASTSSVTPDSILPVNAATDERKTEKTLTIQKTPTFADEPRKSAPERFSIKKTPTFADEPRKSAPDRTKSKTPLDPAPSTRKIPSLSNDQISRQDGPKADTPHVKRGDATPKPEFPPIKRPPTPPTETRRSRSSTKPGTNEMHADAWEKAEMAKIKERYEKLDATISTWETKKKKKAKSKLDKIEGKSELERRRAKAFQKFRSDLETIEQIAGGARAQAEENRRKEESKAKEKANIIRTTGKLPKTCFCF